MPDLTPQQQQQKRIDHNFFLLLEKLCDENSAFLTLQKEILKQKLKEMLLGEQAEKKEKEDLAFLLKSTPGIKNAPMQDQDASSWIDKLATRVREFALKFTTTLDTFRATAIHNANVILRKHNIPAGTQAHKAVHTIFNNALQPAPLFKHFIAFKNNPQLTETYQTAAHPVMHPHIQNALTPRPAPSASQEHHDRFEEGLIKAAALFGVSSEANRPHYREITPAHVLKDIFDDYANSTVLNNFVKTFRKHSTGGLGDGMDFSLLLNCGMFPSQPATTRRDAIHIHNSHFHQNFKR